MIAVAAAAPFWIARPSNSLRCCTGGLAWKPIQWHPLAGSSKPINALGARRNVRLPWRYAWERKFGVSAAFYFLHQTKELLDVRSTQCAKPARRPRWPAGWRLAEAGPTATTTEPGARLRRPATRRWWSEGPERDAWQRQSPGCLRMPGRLTIAKAK
jgi:hypothetical protein